MEYKSIHPFQEIEYIKTHIPKFSHLSRMYLLVIDAKRSYRSAILSCENYTKKVYSFKPFEWNKPVVNDFHTLKLMCVF